MADVTLYHRTITSYWSTARELFMTRMRFTTGVFSQWGVPRG